MHFDMEAVLDGKGLFELLINPDSDMQLYLGVGW